MRNNQSGDGRDCETEGGESEGFESVNAQEICALNVPIAKDLCGNVFMQNVDKIKMSNISKMVKLPEGKPDDGEI